MNGLQVHPSAVVDLGAKIGFGTRIWHFAHVCTGATIGEKCSLGQNVYVASNVIIGNNVKIQNNVSLYEGVVLEDDVFCGPSMVFTNVRTPRSSFPRNSPKYFGQTRVRRGATLGANCTVICGTTIGEWSFVAAGAVVTRDVTPHALVAGVPARQIGWVCECAIAFRLEMGRGQCRECGKRYQLNAMGGLESDDSARSVQIPPLDLRQEISELMPDLTKAIHRVLTRGQFVLGEEVQTFEKEVATYLGVKHAIGLNSGTDALIIALRSLGIGPGDEVITTPFTFFATAEAISIVGATPVFVDIDSETLNIDPLQIEITSKTKAIIPVHLFGHAADMDLILEKAQLAGIPVIEDVAQAFGGQWRGRKLGTLGTLGCFSFFPSKNLGAYGDGGLLVTNDDLLALGARKLRTHGSIKKYFNETLGYNSRLDEIQAAILRVKLPQIEKWNAMRIDLAGYYNRILEGLPGIQCPAVRPDARHVYHQYTLRIANGMRDRIQEELQKAGIQTMVYYPVPVHRLPVYRDRSFSLPLAEKAASQVISLPIWPQMSHSLQDRVADNLKKVFLSIRSSRTTKASVGSLDA